ncbi:MAG: BtpA/SgcQ family protein [Deltaproteobacteria bacterium]|nr:BtpA/SgcQ family protein [Deltaproteobacteria bacterium]
MRAFAELLTVHYPVLGVLHLPPLPGSPRPSPGLEAILQGALRDAEALAEGGADGVIVENLGDAPFSGDVVEPHVTACLAVVAREVRRRFGERLVVGVNALRNDALAALGACAAAEAGFIRVNVLVGAMVTDQGLLQGRARDVLLYRQRVCPQAGVLADVLVKHASPLGTPDLVQTARDTFLRAGADVLILSGSGTGQPTDPARLRAVREGVPEAPLWIGSGVSLNTAATLRGVSTGAIVGTALHEDGALSAPLSRSRVERMVGVLKDR